MYLLYRELLINVPSRLPGYLIGIRLIFHLGVQASMAQPDSQKHSLFEQDVRMQSAAATVLPRTVCMRPRDLLFAM